MLRWEVPKRGGLCSSRGNILVLLQNLMLPAAPPAPVSLSAVHLVDPRSFCPMQFDAAVLLSGRLPQLVGAARLWEAQCHR